MDQNFSGKSSIRIAYFAWYPRTDLFFILQPYCFLS
uniref:Uncharacterized protein n=1 Tax=Arundo donax TaxID=35708 RepID=A0A0A9DXR1_ARUDO